MEESNAKKIQKLETPVFKEGEVLDPVLAGIK